MRTGRITTAALATLAAAWLAFAAPAQAAGWDHSMWTDDAGDKCGFMGFDEHGDHVMVRDTDQDGYGAIVDVFYQSSGTFAYRLSASFGDKSEDHSWASFGGKHNLAEGRRIKFDIYCYDKATHDSKGFDTATWVNDH